MFFRLCVRFGRSECVGCPVLEEGCLWLARHVAKQADELYDGGPDNGLLTDFHPLLAVQPDETEQDGGQPIDPLVVGVALVILRDETGDFCEFNLSSDGQCRLGQSVTLA